MGNNIGGCPACEKCPERPCYPQGTVYILLGTLIAIFTILLIVIGFGCYRLGRFRGHKRGVKKGEDTQRHRGVETEMVAKERLANVTSLLALTLARGNREQGTGVEIEEQMIGGAIGGTAGGAIESGKNQPMLLFGGGSPQQTPQRPLGIQQQQMPPLQPQQQGTPQPRIQQHQIENPMFQYQSFNRNSSSKRFNTEGTFII